ADGQPADESVAFNLPPRRFPYGYSKVQAEQVVHEAVQRGQEVVIVNPVVEMGPGDLNLISGNFVTQIKHLQWAVPLTSGGAGARVGGVREGGRWQLGGGEGGQVGERYLLGTANVNYHEWYALIADTVGVAHPFFSMPTALLPFIAAVVDGLRRVRIQLPVDA